MKQQQPASDDVEPLPLLPFPQHPTWRTEPEINEERKAFLNQCLTVTPGIYIQRYRLSRE